MSTPLKWTVDVDDREHPIGGGKPILTACQGDPARVQVWTDEGDLDNVQIRAAIVVGTGQAAPEGWEHVGSVVASYTSPLVWHVYRQTQPQHPVAPPYIFGKAASTETGQ